MPVVEEDGDGGTCRTNRARKERKGTPQGAPISPLLSNIYMRRFILGWKALGYARRFGAEIVNYADDFCVLGKAPAAETLAVVNRLMDRLKLPVNAQKTRCLRCPEEPLEFLGYRIGWNYRPTDGGRYIGTRPSKASVQSICRRISAQTGRRCVGRPAEEVVGRLNRMISGWVVVSTKVPIESLTPLQSPHRKDNITDCHVYFTRRICRPPLFVAFRTKSTTIRRSSSRKEEWKMKKSQLLGLILWRAGILLVAAYFLFLALRFALRITDPMLEVGVTLVLAGGLFVLVSVVREQIEDARKVRSYE